MTTTPSISSSSTQTTKPTLPVKFVLPIFATKVVHSKNDLTSGCVQYTKADCTAHGPKESLNLAEKATPGHSIKISKINYKKIAMSTTDNSVFENNVK
eukprot:4540874-Ditylum_brightwellii.AAC.1